MKTATHLESPSAIEAERSILGAILLDEAAMVEAQAELRPEDFFLDAHRLLFRRMCGIRESGKHIDAVTIAQELKDRRESELIGGIAYVASLTDGLPRRHSIATYTRLVREKSQLRRLITLCESTAARAYEHDETEEILADAHSRLVEIIASNSQTNPQWLMEFSDREWAKLLKERESKTQSLGLDTGLEKLNARTGGIMPGEFWLLGGKTSDGKSAYATEVAARNASNGKAVGIFSTEMTREEILRRIWTQNLSIDRASSKMRDVRRLSEIEFNLLKEVKNWAATLTIKVEDCSPLDIRTFDAKARMMVQRDKVELIVLDHIHEMEANAPTIREKFMKIAECIRRFTRETRVPVLGLAQFPKPHDKSKLNRRPSKHDFGETGSLEQKAHVCLLLYRPLDEENMPTGEDEIIIGKNRNGGISIVPVRLNTHSLRYELREVTL